MNYLNILTEFFTFLLNFISTYIGSLLSIVVLSFLVKIMLYKNQVDNLNNSIKRDLIHDDIQKLLQRFNKTKNLAKRKTIKKRMKTLKLKVGIIPFRHRFLLIIIQLYVLASFIRALYHFKIYHNNILWFSLNNKDPYYILPFLILLINSILEWPYKKSISNFIFYIIANICIFILTTQLKCIVLIYWIVISLVSLIIKYIYIKNNFTRT